MDRRRHRLVERRRVVGLSQEGVAEAIGVDRTTVARWERGETDPQPWHRPHLANALQVSVEELAGLLTDGDAAKVGSDGFAGMLPLDRVQASADADDALNRRELLVTGGVVVADAALSAPTRVAQAFDVVISDSADGVGVAVDCLNELVDHYSLTVCRLPSMSVYDELLSVRTYARKVLDRAGPVRRYVDLVVATGWLSNLLAVAASDLGDAPTALVWCSDAERRGQESAHPELVGWATLTRTVIAYYQGQTHRSVALAARGQRVAPAGTAANAKLAAQEMRARAMLGDTDGMAQAKHRAAAAVARLPADVATTGIFSIPLAEDPPYTATSLLLVGQFEEAVSATSQVLDTAYPGNTSGSVKQTSSYARALLILGLAEAGRGRAAEAAAAGRTALDSAGPVWPTMVLADKLDQALTRSFAGTTETADYHACYLDAADRAAGRAPRATAHTESSR